MDWINIAWFGAVDCCGPRSSFRSYDISRYILGDSCAVACNFYTILHIKLSVNDLSSRSAASATNSTEDVRATHHKQLVSGQGVRRRGSEWPSDELRDTNFSHLAVIGSQSGQN